MKKTYLIGFVLLILMSICVSAYSLPTNYILFEADSVTENDFNINGCELKDLTNSYLLTCSGTDEVQRALLYKTLFYGTDGTDPAVLSATNIEHIYTSFSRDVGKTASYIYGNMNIGSDGDPPDSILTGTFSDTTANNNVSSWSWIYAKSVDSSSSRGQGSWYIPTGTIRHDNNQVNTNTEITSDETGLDLTADEVDNPTDMKLQFYQEDNGDAATVRVFLLHTENISYAVSGSGSAFLDYTTTNFYVNSSIPLLENLSETRLFVNVTDSLNEETIESYTATVTDGTFTETYNSVDEILQTNFYDVPFISRDLISVWNLNQDDNVTVEDQVGSNDGTLNGKTLNNGTITGATYATHTGNMTKFGDYLEFDGNSDYVTLTSSYYANETITQCGWVYIIDNSSISGVFGYQTENNQLLMNGDGRFRFSNNNLGRRDYSIYGVTPENIWQYICINTADRKIYRYNNSTNLMDDITGSLSGVGITTASNVYNIGTFTTGSLYFNGSIDEVKNWNYDLSTTEMIDEATSVGVANPEGIVAYYNFDEGSGTTAYDKNYISTGLNENVTAYNFDGVDDYIEVTHTSDMLLDDFTIDFWANRGEWADTSYDRFIEKDFANCFTIARYSSGNGISFFVKGTAINDDTTINTDTYYKHTFTRTGTTGKIYRNGINTVTGTVGSGSCTDTDNLYIGANYNTKAGDEFFNGSIALPKIYDRVLNETEILDLYTRELNDERYPFSQGNVNITISNGVGFESRPYFGNTTLNQNVSISPDITLGPYVKINATDSYNSTKLYDFDIEYNLNNYNSDGNGNVFLPIISPSLIELTKTNYFDYNNTLSPYAKLEASVIPYTAIYASSYPSENKVFNFTIEYTNDNNVDDTDTLVTTSGVIYVPFYNSSYTVQIRPQSFEYETATLTASPYLQNYTFTTLLPGKSILANFVDIVDQTTINNVSFDLIGDNFANNYTTTNGSLFLEDLVADEYVARFSSIGYITNYYLFTIAENFANSVTLYMVPDDNNTIVKPIRIVDLTGQPVEGATVKSLRYNLATNQYQTLSIIKSNPNGVTYHYLTFNDEFFKFVVEYDGETKLVSEPEIIVTSNQLTLQIDIGSKLLASFNNDYIDLDYTLSFNNATSNVVYTYNQLFTIGTETCLVLYDTTYGDRTQINNSCATTSTNTLSLPVYDLSMSYEARAIYLYDGNYYFIDMINIEPDSTSEFLGNNLFIFQIIITLVILGVSIFGGSEFILITFPMSLIIGRLLNLNYLDYTSLFILQVVFIIIAYLAYRRR